MSERPGGSTQGGPHGAVVVVLLGAHVAALVALALLTPMPVPAGLAAATTLAGVTALAWVVDRRVRSRLDGAQAVVMATDARLRSMMHHGNDLVVTLDGDDIIRFASDSARRVLGVDAAELVGRNGLGFVHPDDLDDAKALTGPDQRPGSHRGGVLRLRHADGGWRVCDVRATNLMADPRVGAVVVNVSDVTDRWATERELVQSETRFRALVEHASDVIAILEADATLRYVSPAAERVLGHRPSPGTPVFDELVHPEDAADAERAFVDALAQPGITAPRELRLRHSDGSYRTVEVVANSLVGTEPLGRVVVIGRDVTERKEAERRLHEAEQLLMDAARRQRQALEINDNVVQGLAVARYALETGDQALVDRTLERTLGAAKAIISDLLDDGRGPEIRLEPGDLVRARPADVLRELRG